MTTSFQASESVSIAVPTQPVSIKHYLRQPQRLIHALSEQSKIETLRESNLAEGHHAFRLKMQPLHFLQLTIQPNVDMEVWAEADGTVHLRSLRSEIRGTEYINQRFALKLVGQLKPQISAQNKTCLIGKVDLKISVDMPAIFLLTPPFLLEVTGTALLKSVLLAMKQRLMQRLITDYTNWARDDANATVNLGNARVNLA